MDIKYTARFESGQNRPTNNHTALLILIRDNRCSTCLLILEVTIIFWLEN